MNNGLPSISVVIPTLNSERALDRCLESVDRQDYPRDRIEVIIVDAGSMDGTLETARRHKVDKVLPNPLRTGEAGKVVGIDASTREIVALIDSDNVLDGTDWLRRMVKPFENPQICSSEPLYWTYRREDSVIDRYCALTGVNDPLCLFLGNYDRYSYLSGKWTCMRVKEEIDRGDYLEVVIDKDSVPTMGANGYLVRRDVLKTVDYHPYYFDIDVVYQLVQMGYNRIARPKTGIIHLYCDGVGLFHRKQKRRIDDYFYFKKSGMRQYKYDLRSTGYASYIVSTVLVLPLIYQSVRGYARKRDTAWFFHPLACWITLVAYGSSTIKGMFRARMQDRSRWSQ